MMKAKVPADEAERLEALSKYHLLDTVTEDVYERITSIASKVCEVPICLISIIDKDKQWFKANHGLAGVGDDTPRDISFCGHAIHDDALMEVNDAEMDDRFFDNPLVLNKPNIRFYAGMPLVNPEGYKLGTICVIDSKPKALTEKQKEILADLSKVVIALFESRKVILNDFNKILDTESKLREVEEFKSAILKSISEGIITIDKQGKIFSANAKIHHLFGYANHEILGTNLYSLIADKTIDLTNVNASNIIAIKKDQSKFCAHIIAAPLKLEDKNLFVLTIREQELPFLQN